MPPKAKTESAELQVFNLDNLNPALLPELATFKEIQLKVVQDNPFVVITDAASRDLAKKYRTARVSARTALQGQDKLISSKFNEAKTKAKTYIAELIAYTLTGEIEQQKEIDRDEAEVEAKRQEKARIEQQRIDNIKKELEDYEAKWKNAFGNMTFETIEKLGADFLDSYTTYDLTVLEEFESFFPKKVEELTNILSYHTTALTEKENARLEKEKKDLELKRTRELISTGFSFDGNNYFVSDFKRLDMATILYLSDESFEEVIKAGKVELNRLAKIEADKALIAKEAEAKIIADREKFEKEKAEFEENKRIEKQKSEYQLKVDGRISQLTDLELKFDFQSTFVGFNFFIDILDIKTYDDEKWNALILKIEEAKVTPLPETIKGIEVEEQAIELIQNLNLSAPIETTANVCSPIMTFEGPTKENRSNLKMTPLTPEESFEAPTWDSIESDFKNSGSKSYSKWLKDNYNVPTKL